jgi:hypothetical protein
VQVVRTAESQRKSDLKSVDYPMDYPLIYLRREGSVPLLSLSPLNPKIDSDRFARKPKFVVSGYLERQWHEKSKVEARYLV